MLVYVSIVIVAELMDRLKELEDRVSKGPGRGCDGSNVHFFFHGDDDDDHRGPGHKGPHRHGDSHGESHEHDEEGHSHEHSHDEDHEGHKHHDHDSHESHEHDEEGHSHDGDHEGHDHDSHESHESEDRDGGKKGHHGHSRDHSVHVHLHHAGPRGGPRPGFGGMGGGRFNKPSGVAPWSNSTQPEPGNLYIRHVVDLSIVCIAAQ